MFQLHDYEQAINVGKDWEASETWTDDYEKERLYSFMATSYVATSRPREAISYYQKALPYTEPYYKGSVLASIADCYESLNNRSQAEDFIKQALNTHLAVINRTHSDVIAGTVRDEMLGYIYNVYASIEESFNRDYSQRDYYMKLSAKCGWQNAIDYCFKYNINYTR